MGPVSIRVYDVVSSFSGSMRWNDADAYTSSDGDFLCSRGCMNRCSDGFVGRLRGTLLVFGSLKSLEVLVCS